jgi:hypothetical protein
MGTIIIPITVDFILFWKECVSVDDLKQKVKDFFDELEYVHLKKAWPERLIGVGIDEREAHTWAAEIGHVVEEYQSSLMRLADLLQETDPERIPRQVHSWAVGRIVVSIPEIEEPMHYLEKLVEKYLPPEPEESDDEDQAP